MAAITDFIKSPGGSSIITAILGGIGGMGKQKSDERMAALDRDQQNIVNLQTNQLNRDNALANQAPTGWAQNFQQQQMMKDLMAQRLQGGKSNFTPINPDIASRLAAVSGNRPQISPEWQGRNLFSPEATDQSLAQRQGVLDLLSQGRGPGLKFDNPELQQQTNDYRKFAAQQGQLGEAINLNRQGTNQTGGGIGGMVGKIAGGVGSAVLPSLIGGIASKVGGGALGSLIGGAGGMGAGLALSPMTLGLSAAIPAAIMGGKALWNKIQQGPHTNDERDAYKGQYGDNAGNGLLRAIEGTQNATGEEHQQLINAYEAFNKAGSQDALRKAIAQMQQYGLSPQAAQQSQQVRNPYIS